MADDWKRADQHWRDGPLDKATRAASERRQRFSTISDVEIERLYSPLDWQATAPAGEGQLLSITSATRCARAPVRGRTSIALRDVGYPGSPPFTRGIHPTGYRTRLWTMRMFAGFGSAEDTNERFHQLLNAGQTGLSIAYDMPTLYGYDTDDPEAEGEFGTCGVAVSSLADMEVLLDGLPLDRISTSMTINSPAAPIWAMYIAAAEKRGFPRAQLEGTTQNDILKEFVAQKEFLFPPEPSIRLVTDTIEFGTRELPQAGTRSRFLATTSARPARPRSRSSPSPSPTAWPTSKRRLSAACAWTSSRRACRFFFNSHNDFFEEIAKFRAARRIWWKLMTQRYRAENERSTWMRFHTQTAGVSLTAQQPLNNLTRVAIQALAAVLGGTQSLHTDAYDEAWAVPSAEAALLALRQQQVIASETGVTNTVDPLGGSWFVESLTNEVERQVWRYLDEIDALGGMVKAIAAGFPQKEIADCRVSLPARAR